MRTIKGVFIVFQLLISLCQANMYSEESDTKPSPQNKWGLTSLVWNFGIAGESDIGPDAPYILYQNYLGNHFNKSKFAHVKSGDVVWMRTVNVPQFCKEVLPTLAVPIVLVINDGDESFPSAIKLQINIEELLANKKIIHIFAQNNDYKGPSRKVSHLPIGIDFHTIAYKYRNAGYWGQVGSPYEQEKALKNILANAKPTSKRKKKAFVDFQINDGMRLGHCRRYLETGEDRTMIFNTLCKTNLLEYTGQMMPRMLLWKIKSQYAFSISPHGNGLDCHRTWEDLALGCIVIVKTSALDPMYEGLPVVIVKDWSEVNEANFDKWLADYGDAMTNPEYRERLTNRYWLRKIKVAALPYRNNRTKNWLFGI